MKNTVFAILATLFTACVDAPEPTSSSSDDRADASDHPAGTFDNTDGHADTSTFPLGTIEQLCRASARDICKDAPNPDQCFADEYAQCIAG